MSSLCVASLGDTLSLVHGQFLILIVLGHVAFLFVSSAKG